MIKKEIVIDGQTYVLKEKVEEKQLTYSDISKQLFEGKKGYYIQNNGEILPAKLSGISSIDFNSALSKEQLENLLEENKLINTAIFLNDGWMPDWNNENQKKWMFKIDDENILDVDFFYVMNCGEVYFKSEEAIQEALKILGKESIKKALTKNY